RDGIANRDSDRSHHLHDVCDRIGTGGSRRNPLRTPVLEDRSANGHSAWTEGFHRGGVRRNRQRAGGGGGRVSHRTHRVVPRRQPLLEFHSRDLLRDPDRHSFVPAIGIVRQIRGGEGLKRLPWWLRDFLFATVFIAVLIGISYAFDMIH